MVFIHMNNHINTFFHVYACGIHAPDSQQKRASWLTKITSSKILRTSQSLGVPWIKLDKFRGNAYFSLINIINLKTNKGKVEKNENLKQYSSKITFWFMFLPTFSAHRRHSFSGRIIQRKIGRTWMSIFWREIQILGEEVVVGVVQQGSRNRGH